MIEVLQAGRIMAALAVVIHHARQSTSAFIVDVPDLPGRLLDLGYLGVDFFFVLSGFIIHFTASKRNKRVGDFATSRLVRIFVPYWPIGLAMGLAYSLAPGLSQGDHDWGWFATATLMPAGAKPALSVAWTLQFEMFFYLSYAALMWLGCVRAGITVWAFLICFAACTGSSGLLGGIPLAVINLEFVAGIAVAELVMRSSGRSHLWLMFVGLPMVVLWVIRGGHRSESVLVGIFVASCLPPLIQAESLGRIRIAPWVVWWGGASYSVYLIHNPALSVVGRSMAGVGSLLGWGVSLALMTVVVTAAGGLYHLAWEKRALRVVGSRLRGGCGATVHRTP